MARENYLMGWPVSEPVRAQLASIARDLVPAVMPGSVHASCVECRMLIWMGPRQQQMIIEDEARPICPWCAHAMEKSMPAVSYSLEEVIEWRKRTNG